MAQALLAGEPEAFEKFVASFRSKLFHYSWMMCGQADDAEDVAQETLLKAFQNLSQLRQPDRVRAWVFHIAKNVCLMRRRKSLFAPAEVIPMEELSPDVEPSDGELLPDAALLQTELRSILDRVILELPPLYRTVVLLRDIEELSTEETAQILDVSPDAVKTRLHRGRSAMRQKLDCYVNHNCLEDRPYPAPSPLTQHEREELYATWRRSLG
jgi:RNA polymerase sigma-70 factor, ECF subfamily